MIKALRFFILMALIPLAPSALGQKLEFGTSDDEARIVPLGGPSNIKTLRFSDEKIDVEEEETGAKPRLVTEIKGKYNRPGWSLILSTGKILIEEKASELKESQTSFAIKAEIRGSVSYLDFYAVGPNGEIEEETLTIDYPHWSEFEEKLKL